MTIQPAIVRADAAEASELAELIGVAFAELPPSQWLVPEPAERARVLSANFRIFVDFALAHGEVHVTEDRTGVAVWFPRDQPLPEPENYDARVAQACGPGPTDSGPSMPFSKRTTQPHHTTI